MKRKGPVDLSKKKNRNALTHHREPWWHVSPELEGLYVGYRVHKDGNATWIARYRDKYQSRTHSCGHATSSFDYRDAVKVARKWHREEIKLGTSRKRLTVSEVCQHYLDDVREDDSRKNPERSYQDARWRIRKYVDAMPIGSIVVKELRAPDLRKWWRGLGGAKASQNRTLAILHAALNMAVRDRLVGAEVSVEWKAIRKHTKPGKKREVYLTVGERKALVDACDGGFADFVKAAIFTGCRPGDLASARVRDFHGKSITFASKTEAADVPLSADAQALFRRLSKSKLPAAFLFVRDNGEPYYRKYWAESFRRAARAALPDYKKDTAVMYSLRHSWITDCLTSGMPAIEVAKVARTSIKMLEDNYWQLIQVNLEDRLNEVKML